jgi:uncharacterized protein (DUF433 family)
MPQQHDRCDAPLVTTFESRGMMDERDDAIDGSTSMELEEIRRHIATDPAICHGQPCIRGTRILVTVILDALAAGEAVEGIMQSYPSLTPDDIRACLGYAALLAHDDILVLPA